MHNPRTNRAHSGEAHSKSVWQLYPKQGTELCTFYSPVSKCHRKERYRSNDLSPSILHVLSLKFLKSSTYIIWYMCSVLWLWIPFDRSLQWSGTPVMYAARNGHLHIVRMLVEHGGAMFHKAKMGHTWWWYPQSQSMCEYTHSQWYSHKWRPHSVYTVGRYCSNSKMVLSIPVRTHSPSSTGCWLRWWFRQLACSIWYIFSILFNGHPFVN